MPLSTLLVGDGGPHNKIAWNKTGDEILIGSANGKVYKIRVGDAFQPGADDAVRFQRKLADLNQ